MTARSRGRDLFIVDNSVSGWTGLRYLKEWAGIAKAFDIATGYFEIGARPVIPIGEHVPRVVAAA